MPRCVLTVLVEQVMRVKVSSRNKGVFPPPVSFNLSFQPTCKSLCGSGLALLLAGNVGTLARFVDQRSMELEKALPISLSEQ
jgi:hypothetical protein